MKTTFFGAAVALLLTACGDSASSSAASSSTAQDSTAIAAKNFDVLLAMFPEMQKADLHVQPCLDTTASREAGWGGVTIPTALLGGFDEQTADFYRNSGQKVFAIGRFKDLYLARVPGKYDVTDVALFSKTSDNKLTLVNTLAWSWSDEGVINQQDGWVRDLNGDGKFDYVTRAITIDEAGKPSDEDFKTYLQMSDGSFVDTLMKSVKRDVFKRTKLK